MKVRERIENSGTDHRWEFDRKRLFEQTNYMAKICENLHEVAVVLDQFQKFLGPELKAVTGDAKGIDEVVERVQSLVPPLEKVPFDIFERRYKTSWDTVMGQFREDVEDIEERTKTFIDTSFQKLRSAEGAFDLLRDFQNIQSRDSINKQMMQKFDDILVQYTKELELVEGLFRKGAAAAPIFKNYPPAAGKIAWAKALYLRVKKPIMGFRTMESVFKDSDTWQEVTAKYVDLARSIKIFCDGVYDEWMQSVGAVSALLQEPIFGPPLVDGKMPDGPFYVNFRPELKSLIRETKYLDRMGFKVPEAALNVALQESAYHGHVQQLKIVLKMYDAAIKGLTPIETTLLATRLDAMRGVLMTGFDPCNWCSLHIHTLIDQCTKAINEFQSIVSQVERVAS